MADNPIITVTESKKYIVLFVIVILLFCLFWILTSSGCNTKKNDKNNIEGYYNFCGSCEGKTVGQCMECANCGFISKKGYGQCVEGDSYGPYDFDPEFVGGRWIHNDVYWTNILTNDDTAIPTTHVYNNRYPYFRKMTERRYGNPDEQPKPLDQAGWIKIEHDMIKPTYAFNAKPDSNFVYSSGYMPKGTKPEGRTLADSSDNVDEYSNDVRSWLRRVY